MRASIILASAAFALLPLAKAAPIDASWAVSQVSHYNLTAALAALESAPVTLSDTLKFLTWNTLWDLGEATVNQGMTPACHAVVGRKYEWVRLAVECGGQELVDEFNVPINASQVSNITYLSHKYLDPVCTYQDDCRNALKSFHKRALVACTNETVIDNHATPAILLAALNATVPNFQTPSSLPVWANISSPSYALNFTVTDIFDLLNTTLAATCTVDPASQHYCAADLGALVGPAVVSTVQQAVQTGTANYTALLATVAQPSVLCSNCTGYLLNVISDHANDPVYARIGNGTVAAAVSVVKGLRTGCPK